MALRGQIPIPSPPPAPARSGRSAAVGAAQAHAHPPVAAPPPRRRTPTWLLVLGGIVGAVVVAGVAVGLSLLMGGDGATTPDVEDSAGAVGALDRVDSPTPSLASAVEPAATPEPSPTGIPEPAPLPTRTPEPSPTTSPTSVPPTPTETPEPSPTAVPPTATPSPAPTTPVPTTPPPTDTPTPEPSPTSPPSQGPLSFPVPTQLDGYESAQGGYRCLIVVRISGGAPPFTVHHDVDQFVTNDRDYYLYFMASGCGAIIHTIRVDSSDGQSVSESYWIPAPWCG
jgi:hypothetical protein